jgi:hypothetical protein
MPHRQEQLTDDAQPRANQRIERLSHRTRQRVLERQHGGDG